MKYGCAHVAGLYTVPDGSGTQFADGCDVIEEYGQQALKVYCAASYLTDYPLQSAWSSTPTTVTELAQTTQFIAQLEKDWEYVIFTVFTFANGNTNWWRADISNAKLEAEYTEMKALAVHLLTTYSGTGKKFIIQNWEGDWAFMDSFTPTTAVARKMVDYYAAFLATRQRAIADARAETAHHDVSIRHCVEVNRVVDSRYPNRRRIVNDIAPRLQPDIISYSAYDGTIVDQGGWGANTAAWEAATRPVFTQAIRKIKRAFPGVPIMIGEFGFPENEAPETNDVGTMIDVVREVAANEDIELLIYWEVFDNEPSVEHTYRGYWFQEPDGTQTIAGARFEEYAASVA